MRMRARAASASAAVLLLLLAGGCAGAVYKVGDLDAWGVPPPSKPDVYKRWAKSIHFALGDSICSPTATRSSTLTTPGRAYYASGAPGHCRKGQKLWVDVPLANGTYLQPSATDLAALAPTPAADPPAGFASAPEGASASPAPRAAAAGSVVALCFALQILLL
ncbi:unnamed protein product [Miscanthus lutarioriparius]|uniref:Phytocyanin domain-containing protein n=1 Tax=Miscanthus lutarioriparius TaxID=422564 RepID=A0A811MFN3_9POAL|nr:unnamed protein product [Miscanthus lutarioriparius]